MGICLPFGLRFGGISLAWLDPQDEKYAQKVLFAIILLYGIAIVLGQSAHILLWNQAILPEQNGSLCSSTCAETAVFYSSMVILVMTGMSIGLFQVSGPRVGWEAMASNTSKSLSAGLDLEQSRFENCLWVKKQDHLRVAACVRWAPAWMWERFRENVQRHFM